MKQTLKISHEQLIAHVASYSPDALWQYVPYLVQIMDSTQHSTSLLGISANINPINICLSMSSGQINNVI